MWKKVFMVLVPAIIAIVLLLETILLLSLTTSVETSLTSINLNLARIELDFVRYDPNDPTIQSDLKKAQILLEVARESRDKAKKMVENLPDGEHLLSAKNFLATVKSPVWIYKIKKINGQTNFLVDLADQYVEKLK